MPRGTTGYDYYALGIQHLSAIVDQGRECHMISLDIDTSTHAVCQALRLFEYLFQHKVGIPTFLYLSEVDINGLHRQFLLFTEDTKNLQVLPAIYHSYIAVFEIHHLISIFHDRTGIGTQEELILTDTYYQRTLLTGCNNLIGITLVDYSDCIGTDHLIESHLDSCQQIELLMLLDILDQLHQHLCICVRLKFHTFRLQFFLQVGIVLDNAVMDNRQILR